MIDMAKGQKLAAVEPQEQKKKRFYCEAAYIVGLVILAAGTALMERADFGMSMVVAPAYLLHLKISQWLPFFSFGMAEYVLQALLLIIMCLILREFKLSYLGSFVTAVIYGFILDGEMKILALVPGEGLAFRGLCYVAGMLLCSVGIAFLLHTYLAPEAYELLVKELVAKYGWSLTKVKTIYDCSSCLLALILSFCFFGFGHFEGVKAGTILCAMINGTIIGFFNRILEKAYSFVQFR